MAFLFAFLLAMVLMRVVGKVTNLFANFLFFIVILAMIAPYQTRILLSGIWRFVLALIERLMYAFGVV